MDFAPYQSSPPEHGRTLSPEATASPRTSWDYTRRPFSPQQTSPNAAPASSSSPPLLQHPQPQRAWSGDGIRSPAGGYQSPGAGGGGRGMGDYFGGLGAREGMVSEFDTSLGIRLDYEACLAYLVCPPLGAICLLILERKSDYVRYAALRVPLTRLLEPSSFWLTDPVRPQIPCVAVRAAFHGLVHRTPAILLVKVLQLAHPPWRCGSHSLSNCSGISRRGYA